MQTRKPIETQAADFDLEGFLPYRLSLLTNTISQGIAARYRDAFGISVTEWRILAVLGRFPGLTASEVVERTAMDKVAVHRGVKALAERGLLERQTDGADRRRQNLYLTPSTGQPLVHEIIPRALAFERDLLGALSAKESATLQTLLDKLQRAARRVNEA